MPLESLFRPFAMGDFTLPNRLVMAPMTRNFSTGGVPGPDVAAYYRRRVEGGTSLIITEGTAINHPGAVSLPRIPLFHGEAALAGWRNVVSEVHAAGGRIFPQIWHVGAARKPELSANPDAPAVSPSGLFKPGEPNGRALDEAEITQVIAAYGQAAADAQAIGCDGIELHFAHGYLADQFFWGPTNLRDDAYGRDRYRFGVDVVAECRRRVGPDYPICLRFSQWKQQDYDARLFETPDELAAFLGPLANAGVDIFHCSTRRFWKPEFADSTLNLAGWTRKLSGRPVITVGSVGLDEEFLVTRTGVDSEADKSHLDELEAMLARGEVDLVAVGRALIVDPEWGNKVRNGRMSELNPYSKAAESVLA